MKTKNYWLLVPLFCSLLFAALYFVAAAQYPGGSYEDKTASGFSWAHNYWCNLLNNKALNGEVNTAKPFALAAMAVLAAGLLSFWVICSKQMYRQKWVQVVMQVCAGISIGTLFYLSSAFHDVVINIAGGFGMVAMTGVYIGLYKNCWWLLFWFGVLSLLLIAANNYIYYSGHGFYYLPVVQKVTFLSCLVWISVISWKLYKGSGINRMA